MRLLGFALAPLAAVCLCLCGCRHDCSDTSCPKVINGFFVYDLETGAPLAASLDGIPCGSQGCKCCLRFESCLSSPDPPCGTNAEGLHTVSAPGYASKTFHFDALPRDPSCCSQHAGTAVLLGACANDAGTCQCSSANGGLCRADGDCCDGRCDSRGVCHGV